MDFQNQARAIPSGLQSTAPAREQTVIDRLNQRLSFAGALTERIGKAMNFIDGERPPMVANGVAVGTGFLETYDSTLANFLDEIDSQLRRLERIVGQ